MNVAGFLLKLLNTKLNEKHKNKAAIKIYESPFIPEHRYQYIHSHAKTLSVNLQ